MELIDRIITQMVQDKIPINIYLDFSKAFDTIDHLILIDKLKYYGVNGTHLNLFSSYLNNCKQYTEIDHIKSNMLPIRTGIPQWLKINKLSLNIAKSKYMTFQRTNKNVQTLTLKIR